MKWSIIRKILIIGISYDYQSIIESDIEVRFCNSQLDIDFCMI